MFLLLSLALSFVGAQSENELQFVIVLYRHGARSPSRIYAKDPFQMSYWPNGPKQLTQVGMQQQYELGQFLRRRYMDEFRLLNKTYSREEIYVRSTDKDRALQSAGANLAGLYPPSGRQVWNPRLLWQPVPIHSYMPDDEDLLLRDEGVFCQRSYEMQWTIAQQVNNKYNHQYQDLFAYLKNMTGIKEDLDLFVAAKFIWDPWNAEIYEGIGPPAWANQTWENTGKTVFEMIKFFELLSVREPSDFQGTRPSKFHSGYLLNDILSKLEKRSTGQAELPKMVMYSTHSGTLYSLLENMEIFNDELMPMASCLMVELWKSDRDAFRVRLLFRNDTTQPPHLLTVPGCPPVGCSIQDLRAKFKNRVYTTKEERDADCGNPSAGGNWNSFREIIGALRQFVYKLFQRE